MLEVSGGVTAHQLHDAFPEPARCVECLRTVLAQLGEPCLAFGEMHLPRVRLAHYQRKKTRRLRRFVASELLDRQLHVLRQQLAYHHRAIRKARRSHPVAERRRQMPRALHHPLRVIAWHSHARIARRRSGRCLLDVDQAQIVAVHCSAVDVEKHRVAQPSERTAALDPVGGVEDFDVRLVACATQCSRECGN